MNLKTFKRYIAEAAEETTLSESYDDRVDQVRRALGKESGVNRSNIDFTIEKIAQRMRVLEIRGSGKAKSDFIKDVKKGYKFEKRDRYGFTASSKKELVSEFKKIRTPVDVMNIIRKAKAEDIMSDVYVDEYEVELLNKLAKDAGKGSYVSFIAGMLENDFHDAISNSFPEGDPFDEFQRKFKPWLVSWRFETKDVVDQIAKNIGFRDYDTYMSAIWEDFYNDAKSDYETAEKYLEKSPNDKKKQYILARAKERMDFFKANKW